MRPTDVAVAVPVFLLWIACVPPGSDRATNNDGAPCKENTECDSRICEVDGACRGSNCEKDDGCSEGWTCLRKSGFFGTTGTCVPGCDSCPAGKACQDGGTECTTIPVTLDASIVEPPKEKYLLLKVGEPVKLRADVKVTPADKPLQVTWQVYDPRAPSSPTRYEGIEATHTFTTPGQYYVDVTVTAGMATLQRDATFDVKE